MDENFQNLAKDISSPIQEVVRIPNKKQRNAHMHIKMHHCETSENKTNLESSQGETAHYL